VVDLGFTNRVAALYPSLKVQLRIAHMPYTNLEFVNKSLKVAGMYAFLLTVFFMFPILQTGDIKKLLFLAPIFLILFVRKREREINKEVLFVGRYLLIKLYSGRPLLNALIETATSSGVASKYIKEIVDDISTGSSIEEALENAMTYSPSEKFRRILFHVSNALELGIDVTGPLRNVLVEITKEEELEIKKYGKKLNTLVIFYMLVAIIIPSLGVAIFIVISSFLNLPINLIMLLVIAFFITILQFIFIALFKSVRPMVNL
jgi:pilus assembly protein TadC